MVGGGSMHRVIVDPGFAVGQRVPLAEEDRHHLRVRRAEAGQRIEVLDGQGRIGVGRLVADGRDLAAVVESIGAEAEPPGLWLLVGAGDKDRFLWLAEKAVELGVTDLVPVDTARSRNVATRLRGEHHDRVVRRAEEALKQAGGAWSLRLHPVVALAPALASLPPGPRLLADPTGGPTPACGSAEAVTVAIGPEGGFTDEERSEFGAAGFVPVRLANRILRFETAALAAAVTVALRRKETS